MFVTLANYIINLVGWRDSSKVRRKALSKQTETTIFHLLISFNSFINYEASQACFQETYQSNIGQLNCIEIQFFFTKSNWTQKNKFLPKKNKTEDATDICT